jgi:hypothetical protein
MAKKTAVAEKPQRPGVPPEFKELGLRLGRLRDEYEELKAKYTEWAVDLAHSGVYLTVIAAEGPFSYATVRSWTLEEDEE